jgi:peptide/nickel transport system substrate-binding protein
MAETAADVAARVILRRRASILAVVALVLCGPAAGATAAEKVLVHALEGQPESLDPAKASSERSIRVTWLVCDALVNVSRDGQGLEPGLAESWTTTPDGLRTVARLRRGVTFHDGTPLDAAAVKASFEREFRPDHELYTADPNNAKAQLLSQLIEDIQAPDPLTVAFTLKYPGLHYLSQIEVVSPTAAARLGREFGRSPVCSGPFRFESWAPDRIVLSANDRYWAGRPKIDRVVFRIIPETRAVVEALFKGEVDFVATLPEPLLFERLRENPRVRLVPVSGLNINYLGFYTDRAPFDNSSVRRAVAHAINVPRLVLFLARGASTAARGPLPPAMKGYDAAAAQPLHDPQLARDLLAKAGAAAGLTVSLVHNSAMTLAGELAGAIQSDLRRVGINVQLLGKPSWRDLVSAARAREGDMFLYNWHVRAPYPERLLVPLFHSRSVGTTNLTRYRNTVVDRLLDEALQLAEGPRRVAAYSQVQRLIVDDLPAVFLYHATRMAAFSDRIQALELNLGSLPHDKLTRVDLAP